MHAPLLHWHTVNYISVPLNLLTVANHWAAHGSIEFLPLSYWATSSMTRLQVTLGNFLVFEKQPRKWSRTGPLEESTFLQSYQSAFAENKYHQQVWPITSIKLVTPTKQLAFTSSTTRLWPLCTGQFQNRPCPPRANPGAFDFFEKFWSNSPLCCQDRRSNAPPVRASKRVKSPTLQACYSWNKRI